jgi:AcrR family transcriptional regulator
MAVTAEPRLTSASRAARPAASPADRPPDGIERRAIDALLRCVARHGLGKTTLDDVAREAGCARATLYRYFGGKQQLVRAMLESESARIFGAIRAAGDAEATFEDSVVAILGAATRELRGHAALGFVLAFEPELVLPHVTFSAGDRFLAGMGTELAPALERFVGADRSERAGEWVARIVLGYAVCPDEPTDLTDDASTRTLAREFVVPGLAARRSQPSVSTRG